MINTRQSARSPKPETARKKLTVPTDHVSVRATVLLSPGSKYEPRSVRRVIETQFGATHSPPGTTGGKGTRSALQMRIGGALLTICHNEHPTSEEIEKAAAGTWWWPQAVQVCRACTGALVVEFAASPAVNRYERAILFSRLLSTIAGSARAIAIWWDGGPLNDTAAFTEMLEQSTLENLPLYLWVEFIIQRYDDARFLLVTSGLVQFGLSELESIVPTAEISTRHEQMFNIAGYLCEHGMVLQDGNTIEVTESQQALVRHEPSLRGAGHPVIRIYFP